MAQIAKYYWRVDTATMSTNQLLFPSRSEYVVEKTTEGAAEGAKLGAVYGPFGAGFGAGWGAALGYLDGVTEEMMNADYPSMMRPVALED